MMIMNDVEISNLLSKYCFGGQNTWATKAGVYIIVTYLCMYLLGCW